MFNYIHPCYCELRNTSPSHGSDSSDRVFLTGYKWRQTLQGLNYVHPYSIPRCILTILEELSTFTFQQATRWVGQTNSKSTSLCQSTTPDSTKVDLFYSVWEINIPYIVWTVVGCDRYQINTTTGNVHTALGYKRNISISGKHHYQNWLQMQLCM